MVCEILTQDKERGMTMKRYTLTNYAIQCTDQLSGKVGCFLFDIKHYEKTGLFNAVSPVYHDLQSFYDNTKPEQRMGIYTEYNPVHVDTTSSTS